MIVRDCKAPLTIMNRTTRQKINQKTEDLNQTTNQLDLTDTHKTLHSTTTKCTCFSSACETFSRMYHLLVRKLSLNRFLKRELSYKVSSLTTTDGVRNYSAILAVSPKELKTAFQRDIVHPSSWQHYLL